MIPPMTISQYLDRQPDSKLARATKYLDGGHVDLLDFDLATPGDLSIAVGGARPHRATLRLHPTTFDPTGGSCACRKGTLRRPCAHIICVALLVEEALAVMEEEETLPTVGASPDANNAEFLSSAAAIVKTRAATEALQRYIDAAQFDSPEDLQAFLRSIEGRPIEEVLTEVRGDAPLPPEEAALQMLAEAEPTADPARLRAIAEEALAIDPDCVEAMTERALAEETTTAQIAELKRVVARAGELLGADYFKQHAGHFHDLVRSRPYLRALAYLAEFAFDIEDYAAARGPFEELLRLDVDDHSGARHSLIVLYVHASDFRAVKRLYRAYPDDPYASWHYARAIAAFRELGDTAAARKYRRRALDANPDVVLVAAGAIPYPPRVATYALGGVEEAGWALETLRPIMDPRGGLDTWFDRGLVRYV